MLFGFMSVNKAAAVTRPCLASLFGDGTHGLRRGYASRFRRAAATRPSKPVPSRKNEGGSGTSVVAAITSASASDTNCGNVAVGVASVAVPERTMLPAVMPR